MPGLPVHLHVAVPDRVLADTPEAVELLSADELERMSRFRHERDRLLYLAAHSFLRRVLGRHLNRPPASLRFAAGEHGKPALEDSGAASFSLSHTHGLVAVAVCAGSGAAESAVGAASCRDRDPAPVGVDVEALARIADHARLAERYFAAAESAAILQLPEERAHEAFLAIWTLKEAFVKALGTGLLLPLNGFAFSLQDGGVDLTLGEAAERAGRAWRVAQVEGGGFSLAVAVQTACPVELTLHGLEVLQPVRWRAGAGVSLVG